MSYGKNISVGLIVLIILMASPWIGPKLSIAQTDFVFWQLRIPRMLMAAMVGSILATCGAAYQTIFANPLATPSTVGTTAGASLGALLAVLFGLQSGSALPLIPLWAFTGGLVVTFIVAGIASSGRARVNDVLLAGIAITLATGAISTGLQLQADMTSTFEAIRWSLGNISQVGYQGVLLMIPFALVSITIIFSQIRALDSLVLGEDKAHSQGVSVTKVRTLTLGIGALGVGASVAWCGPIAFVGLIVPHLIRLWLGSSRRILIPMSAICGAGFLVLCDTLARILIPGRELPVGVITAGIGAPLLVWFIAKPKNPTP
ncbi:MAG: iron ABC transporter permease [Myxococcota bacterium]|nr:iron ABC transporter permease [Myxococcota bacterium]